MRLAIVTMLTAVLFSCGTAPVTAQTQNYWACMKKFDKSVDKELVKAYCKSIANN